MTNPILVTNKTLWMAWVYSIVLFVMYGAGLYLVLKSAFLWIFTEQCCCDELWYGLICRYIGDVMLNFYEKFFLKH